VSKLAGATDAGAVKPLVSLLFDGRYPTAEAAARVLLSQKAGQAETGALLAKALAAEETSTLSPMRLGLTLAVWHAADPEAAAAFVGRLLEAASEAREPRQIRHLAVALTHPFVSRKAALTASVLHLLAASLKACDADSLEAIGRAMVWLDERPQALLPVMGDTLDAVERLKTVPYSVQDTLLLALAVCEEPAMQARCARLAATHWRDQHAFAKDVFCACPPAVAVKELGPILQDRRTHLSPHLNGVIKHLGTLAIPPLRARYTQDKSEKSRRNVLQKLELLGEPGAMAIAELQDTHKTEP
jgi:hypothetical protein